MTKDYQEIEEIVEEALNAIAEAVYTDAISLGKAYDLEKAIWVNTLLTYGNARELQVVEIIEKRRPSEVQTVMGDLHHNCAYWEGYNDSLTDLIKEIKKEIKKDV